MNSQMEFGKIILERYQIIFYFFQLYQYFAFISEKYYGDL